MRKDSPSQFGNAPTISSSICCSFLVSLVSLNLVKSNFSFSIDEDLEFDDPTLISCVSVVAAVLGADDLG